MGAAVRPERADWADLDVGEQVRELLAHVKPFVHSRLLSAAGGPYSELRAAMGDPAALTDDVLAEIAVVLYRKRGTWAGLTHDEARGWAHRTAAFEIRHVVDAAERRVRARRGGARLLPCESDTPTSTKTLTAPILELFGPRISEATISGVARARRVVLEKGGAKAWDRICQAALSDPESLARRVVIGEIDGGVLNDVLDRLLGPQAPNVLRVLGGGGTGSARAAAWVVARKESGEPLNINDALTAGIGRGPADATVTVLTAWATHQARTHQAINAAAAIADGLTDHITTAAAGESLAQTRRRLAEHMVYGLDRTIQAGAPGRARATTRASVGGRQ